MHRLLVETGELFSACPSLSKEAQGHLRVLRPKEGEEVELFDGQGRRRVCACRRVGASFALCPVADVQTQPRAPVALTLFACVTKGSRWDWTVEKATELGVTRLVPVISARTIVRLSPDERAAKRLRWQRVAEDAARQSDAKWLPEICEAVDFRDVLPLVKETTCFIGALTVPPSPPLARAVGDSVARLRASGEDLRLAVFIGPEGDLTPDELSALMEIAEPTSFGPTILRAETAALFAVSVLSAERLRRDTL